MQSFHIPKYPISINAIELPTTNFQLLEPNQAKIHTTKIIIGQGVVNNNFSNHTKKNNNVSKVSIIGVGMITTPGVTYRMFQTLANKGINILVIATSEIKISVLINKKNIKKALTALHKEFKLNSYAISYNYGRTKYRWN